MALEFVSFLQAVFFFIELVIYKRICSAQIIDCLSNNQKWKALTTFIMELYDSVMKMIVKKCMCTNNIYVPGSGPPPPPTLGRGTL